MTVCITGETNGLHHYQQIAQAAERLDKGILMKYYLYNFEANFDIDIMMRSFDWYFITGCVEHNTDYYGSNIYNIGDKFANTEKLCQISCQKNPECNWWSQNSIAGDNYGCWLKTKKNIEKKEKVFGRSFGPKFCGKYEPLEI